MHDPKRALRRHHLARLKKARRSDFFMTFRAESPALDKRCLGIHVRTPAPCSCWMCGNPRRHFGQITHQEKAAREAWRGALAVSPDPGLD